MAVPLHADAAFRNTRRDALSHHPTQTGLDYIAVVPGGPGQWQLRLQFVPDASGQGKQVVPEPITPANIRITRGLDMPVTTLRVIEVQAGDNALTVMLQHETTARQEASDFPMYTLALVDVPRLDPFFAQAPFSLRLDAMADVDPMPIPLRALTPAPEPEINYLAKDYSSFRQLMLDRLSLLLPDWTERHAADLGITLVEVLAYAADQLSYYQDAVATEVYLGTARQRVSVRRHARLLDYSMHEGCNARVWVQLQVDTDHVPLASGTPLLTSVGPEARLAPNTAAYAQALAAGPQVFATLHPAMLYQGHNAIRFYTWGARTCSIPQGATQATLRDAQKDATTRLLDTLQVGDVLLFEAVKHPTTGLQADADPAQRHVVRLIGIRRSVDPLGKFLPDAAGDEVPVVEIEWASADALPFDLPIAAQRGGEYLEDISIARGNLVLADHGRTIDGEILPEVPRTGRYRPSLQRYDLTYSVPYDGTLARTQPAALAMLQEPRAARPAVTLYEPGTRATWRPQPDLLHSDRLTRAFVVDMEGGRATLRFGDGVRGKQPLVGLSLQASYRIGNGSRGNVGRETIVHIVTDDRRIIQVRNPLAAQGGTEPEPIEQVRMYAPWAFHTQERGVTAADYQTMAMRHPDVQQAAATLRWTGSWYTAFLAVRRRGGQPVDAAFKAEMLTFMERFRLAGYDLEIGAPRFVPLDIRLTVHVAANHFQSTVRQALREVFSNVDLPHGRRGFFHPEHLAFGQSVYLSQIVVEAVRVPGVDWVEVERFQRWGCPDRGERQAGELTIGPLEIARIENDPAVPEHGIIVFSMAGGR
jgi:hypothetical protein